MQPDMNFLLDRCRIELKAAMAAIDRASMLAIDLQDATGCGRVEIRLADRSDPDAFLVLGASEAFEAQIIIADCGEDEFARVGAA